MRITLVSLAATSASQRVRMTDNVERDGLTDMLMCLRTCIHPFGLAAKCMSDTPSMRACVSARTLEASYEHTPTYTSQHV